MLTVKVNGAPTATTTATTVAKSVPTTQALSSGVESIPRTGNSARDLWTEILLALVVVQIGVMIYSVSEMRRRRRRPRRI